ncbi:MAG: hypothetical protein GXC94_21395, partial [Comamonadaceae bacterium]|nr:hypothetical protein [Comamonadaceae bacterium]
MSAALALPRRSPPDPRLLQRCLLLAVLLHVWLVLVLGNATGTAAPGQGVWGSLTVKLLGRSGGAADAPPGDPAPEQRDNGAPGNGPQPRQGGQLRPTMPAAADSGAAELGRWNPREVAPESARTGQTSDAPPSAATLDLPEGFKPITPESLATAAPPRPPLPAAELPAAVGRLEAEPDAARPALPPPASLRVQPRPAALPALPAELPAAVHRLDAAPSLARNATLPRPAELRAAPAPSPATAAELPPPVRRLEAQEEARVATALPRAAELRAAPDGAAQALPGGAPLPAAVQRLEAAAAKGAVVAPLSRPDE